MNYSAEEPEDLGQAVEPPSEGFSEEVLRNLGIEICTEIDHSETGKGSLPKRWERNEALYNIDPDATNLNLVEGMESYPIPLWKPKADRIIGTVFKSITSIEPYVQCIPVSEDSNETEPASKLEKALMALANVEQGRFGFDRAFRQCLKTAVNTGISVLYVHPTNEGCIYNESIHPKDFCIYPHEVGDLREAKTIGHRFWKMRSDIKALHEAGEYLTDEVGGAGSIERGGKSQEFGGTSDTPFRDPDDELVECWQVVRRCDLDGEVKDWIVCVAKLTQKVLKVVPLEYETSRLYFDIRFDDECGSFWPASSPGQDIQGTQLAYSDAFNVQIQGGYAAAFPSVAIIGATLDAKVKRWGPGTVWELPAGATVEVVGNTFNGQHLQGVIEKLEEVADSTSRISRMGVSQTLPSGTTATAASGMLQAQDEGKDQYTSFAAPVVGEIFAFLHELLKVHFPVFQKKLGGRLGIEFQETNIAVRYQPTGKTSSSSPQALLQKLQMALTLAQNPNSTLEYAAVEDQVMQTLDLPFDVEGLKKKGPTSQEWQAIVAGLTQGLIPMEIVTGVLEGQVSPQEAIQVIQEHMAQSQQGQQPPEDGTGGVPASPGPAPTPQNPGLALAGA